MPTLYGVKLTDSEAKGYKREFNFFHRSRGQRRRWKKYHKKLRH